MSHELLERLGNLDKKIEQLGNQLVDSGTDIHGVRVNSNDGVATMSFFENDHGYSTPQLNKSTMDQLRRFSMMERRRLPENYKPQFKSFSHFLRGVAGRDPEFRKNYDNSIDQLRKANAMSSFDSDSMGMLVLPEFSPKINETLYDELNIVGMTDQYTVSGSGMKFPRTDDSSRANGRRNGGFFGAWLDENDVPPVSRGKIETTDLDLRRLGIVVFFSEQLLEDTSYAVEQWTTKGVRREINFMTGDAIFNGTGGGMPLGFMQSPAQVVVPKVPLQAAGTIVAQNILDMYARMRASASPNEYCWFINQNCLPQLFGMVMPAGGVQTPIFLPPGGLSASPFATLMGLPVKPTEFNSPCGTKGDIALVRMKGYVTINKGGVNERTSEHVEWLREQIAMKFTMRIDGRPMQSAPTVPYKSNGTDFQSDFILLETRA